MIISGLGGEPKYTERFRALSAALALAATRFGLPDSNVVWLGEDSVSRAPSYRGQATRANVERAIQRIAQRAGGGDQVAIILIGHGSGDGADSKISLPGPDVSASDFARMLARFSTQRVAFVNLTS